jgi:DNA-binding response OmpR family regulator
MQELNTSKLILVVDDEEMSMALIADVLGLAGYRVLKASDGTQAVTCLKDHDPDLVIADLNMPNLNGWQLGLWIMENRAKKIPLIFLSSLINEGGPPGQAEFGDYYMPKPFKAEILIKKVEELLTAKKGT